MSDLPNRSIAELFNQNRFPFLLSFLLFIATILSPLFAPNILRPLFDGPDGTRWIAPFFLLMGVLATIYSLFPVFFKEVSYKSELFWAGAVVVFFAGLLIFVSVQRFTSGLRYLETYNEIMGIPGPADLPQVITLRRNGDGKPT